MNAAEDFIKVAVERNLDFYTGVPCSYLTPLINGVLRSAGLTHVGAASEGEAVAIAAGAWLAGRGTPLTCRPSAPNKILTLAARPLNAPRRRWVRRPPPLIFRVFSRQRPLSPCSTPGLG